MENYTCRKKIFVVVLLIEMSIFDAAKVGDKNSEPVSQAKKSNTLKRLNSFSSPCNRGDKHAPCACNTVLTNSRIHRHGSVITVEYPEAVCDDGENNKRSGQGKIDVKYVCTQLKSKTTLYRDVEDAPIEEEIVYKPGCELRHKLVEEKDKDSQPFEGSVETDASGTPYRQ